MAGLHHYGRWSAKRLVDVGRAERLQEKYLQMAVARASDAVEAEGRRSMLGMYSKGSKGGSGSE